MATARQKLDIVRNLLRNGKLSDGEKVKKIHAATAPDPPPPPPPPSDILTTSQIALGYDTEGPLFTEQNAKYRYITFRDNLHDRVGELRQVHPESEFILYKNVAFTLYEPGNCPYYPYQGGGLSYCKADPHEDYFLHDRSGSRLSSDGYPDQRAMNIGNPAYQQAWVDSVLARLRNSGSPYNGVWMDDTNVYPGHGMDGRIKELTDAQYGDAMVNFVRNVVPQIHAAGFKTVVNIGMNPWETEQRADTLEIARHAKVVNREGLVRWGEEGTTWDTDGPAPHWHWEVDLAEDIQRAGASFHAMTYGKKSEVGVQAYARATFLLAWDGKDGSAFNYRTSDGSPTYLPAWTADVGQPISARRVVGRGWRRDFSEGTVIINPSAQGSQAFSLGNQYRRPDGVCTSTVTLAPLTAMIMGLC